MKKFLLLLIAFCAIQAKAQQKLTTKAFSTGLELGIPQQSGYSIGFGGSGKAEVPVAGPVSLTVTAGFSNYTFKKAPIGSAGSPDPLGVVPVKAGAKYYLSQGFYAEGEAGAIFETNYNKDKTFVYTLGLGFVVPLNSASKAIEIGLRYERWNNGLSSSGIRAAYRLGW